MDDAELVRALERLSDLDSDRHGFVERDRPLRNAIGERRSFDQLHDERAHLQIGAASFKTEHLGDVGVVEQRQRLGFALKPRESFGIQGESIWQHFDRDRPAQFASTARYTSPMPPTPSAPVISNGPMREPMVRATGGV